MSKPTVFVVDDQPAICHALKEMLSVLGYQVETYASAQEFLASCDAVRAGCLVSDVRLPGMDGIELMQTLKQRGLKLPVVLISGHADVAMAVQAIKGGAEDFIEKPVDDVKLVAAINRSLANVYEQITERQATEEIERRFLMLTPREVEVLDRVAQGYTSQAIAMMLGISPRTVESYRMQIMDKMQAASVAVLVRQSIRLGRLKA